MSMIFKVKLHPSIVSAIEKKVGIAIEQTADAVLTDIVDKQVMPFDTGTLQNASTFVQKTGKTSAAIVSVTPYARRLYYHPEYNFRQTSTRDNPQFNAHAGGKWFDPWIDGEQKDFAAKAFAELLKRQF